MMRIYSEAEEKKIREQAIDLAAAFGAVIFDGEDVGHPVVEANIARIKSAIEGVEQETGLSMKEFTDPADWDGSKSPNRHDRRRAERGLKGKGRMKLQRKGR